MNKHWFYRIMGVTLTVLVSFALIVCNAGAIEKTDQSSSLSSSPAPALFSDINDSFWAKPAIDKWSSMGVVKGEGGKFNPNGKITRAEMMTILGRIFGYTQTTANPFSDVKASDWYYNVIRQAYKQNIMEGSLDAKGNRMARPNDPLTRAEGAVLYQRLFSVAGNSGSASKLKDPNLPDWAKDAIYGMEAAGYMQGREKGLFEPSGYLTRAEAVQLLDRIVKLYVYQPGTYNADVKGNVVVNTTGAILKNMKIAGNLYLTEGIAKGTPLLENIGVTGSIYVSEGARDANVPNKPDIGDY